jgi:hypothetical protein
MNVGQGSSTVFIIGVTLVAVGGAVTKRRRLRQFACFRVMDAETKQPLANAKVLRIA